METLEKIKMTSNEFGGTEVIDGAGIIQNGDYAMSQEQVRQIVLNRKKIPYVLSQKVKNIINQYRKN